MKNTWLKQGEITAEKQNPRKIEKQSSTGKLEEIIDKGDGVFAEVVQGIYPTRDNQMI